MTPIATPDSPLSPAVVHTIQQLVLSALAGMRLGPAPVQTPVQPATQPMGAAVALSTREDEVLRALAVGDSNKLIARRLGLSPHTVKRHVSNILDKLALASRGQAAAWYRARH